MPDNQFATFRIKNVLRGLVHEIRPWQWYKQAIVLLGLVFSGNLLDPLAWSNAILAVVSFCAAAGATYIFNDISDVEEDRKHPVKRNRPIASGEVSIPTAAAFATFLLVGGLWLASTVNLLLFGVLVAYLVQNVLYSLYLKEVVLMDVILVALGFVLRAVAGVVAIEVYLSPWLVVCAFLAALMLAIGKRRAELSTSDDPAATRATLAEYTDQSLDQLLIVVISTLLLSYSLYTFFRADAVMMATLPFAYFAVFRYHHLIHTAGLGGRPEYLAMDRPFLANLVVWAVLLVAILYGNVFASMVVS